MRFGVHGGIKHFYKIEPEEDLPATLDYIIAAVGGWLTGTLGGVLEARGIPSYPDKLYSEVEGDIENKDGVIVISRIRVKYFIKIPKGKKEAAERALTLHPDRCPAAVSVKNSIEISYSAEIIQEWKFFANGLIFSDKKIIFLKVTVPRNFASIVSL